MDDEPVDDMDKDFTQHHCARIFLLCFTAVNFITYMDRGVVGGCLKTWQNPSVLGLNGTQQGLIGDSFMIGFMIASPIYSQASKKGKKLPLMASGLCVWLLAILMCLFAFDFWSLVLGRMISGVGEASFVCICPVVIGVLAPPSKKSQWLGTFYSAIPVGYALGFVVSGMLLDPANDVFGVYYQWRLLYFAEAIFVLPFILFLVVVETPAGVDEPAAEDSGSIKAPLLEVRSGPRSDEESAAAKPFRDSVIDILSNKTYLYVALGYALQTFVTGSISFYGLLYLEEALNIEPSQAGTIFGGITLVTGVVGSVLGGTLHDWLSQGRGPLKAGWLIINVTAILSLPLVFISFNCNSVPIFVASLFFGELLIFTSLSPINVLLLTSVEPVDSPLAMAGSVVFLHLLGDVPSVAFVGFMLDLTDRNWQLIFTIVSLFGGGLSIIFFLLGSRAPPPPSYSNMQALKAVPSSADDQGLDA